MKNALKALQEVKWVGVDGMILIGDEEEGSERI